MAFHVDNPKHETISFRLELHERHQIESAARGFGDGTISTLLRSVINRLPTIMPILETHDQSGQTGPNLGQNEAARRAT